MWCAAANKLKQKGIGGGRRGRSKVDEVREVRKDAVSALLQPSFVQLHTDAHAGSIHFIKIACRPCQSPKGLMQSGRY